jgi:glycosyltransferase involved in cell wall biosynthesis
VRILHVTPTFYPATYWGGPITSIYGLCNALAQIPRVELQVLTTNSAGPQLEQCVQIETFPTRMAARYDVYYCRRTLGSDISPSLLAQIWGFVSASDVVHLTGVYSSPTIPTLLVCRVLRKPVVWSPRGSLQHYSGSTRQAVKRAWERICDRLLDVKRCVLHVTSAEEARDSAARIRNAGVRVIPNGVDIPDLPVERVWRPNGRTRLLFMGRLHPKKGVENLLLGLARLTGGGVELRICGAGDPKYVSSLHKLADKLGVTECVTFSGHVDGAEKSHAFFSADLCLVPSFTENFGIVVAEALAHGVPVVASRGTPWNDLEEKGCGVWVDNSPESLAQAILVMRTRDLVEMGQRGRQWMKECFRWDMIAQQMHSVYEKLLALDPK